MAQVVKLKRSSVAGNVPTTGQMTAGELAMNTADGKLFLRDEKIVRPILTTGAEITGSLNLTGNITASGNISSSFTGSFGYLRANYIEGASTAGSPPPVTITNADLNGSVTFTNTNLYGNPIFHGDINIYSQSQFLDQSDNIIFESTNNGDPFNGEIQFGGFTIPTRIRGVGIICQNPVTASIISSSQLIGSINGGTF